MDNMKFLMENRIPGRLVGVNMTVFEANKNSVFDVATMATARFGMDFLTVIRGALMNATAIPEQELKGDDKAVIEQLHLIWKRFSQLRLIDQFSEGSTDVL